MDNPIRNVSDTALWVAIYRAMESERSDAFFNDPYARRLGGERGQAIVDAMPQAQSMSWPMVVRTAVMDEIILRCVQQGAATVLNLAAGLDARPYRLPLPPSLRWLHVDLPDMVDYFREQHGRRNAALRTRIHRRRPARADATTRRLHPRRAQGPVLVITEGLLVYLERDQVAELARDLHDIAHAKWWLTDLASPMLLKFLEKQWAPKLKRGQCAVPFRPRRRHRVLRAIRLARGRVPFHLGRILPPASARCRGAWLWKLLSTFSRRRSRKQAAACPASCCCSRVA